VKGLPSELMRVENGGLDSMFAVYAVLSMGLDKMLRKR
jgi:hypothetical protein